MNNNSAARTSPSLLGRLRQETKDEVAWSEFVRRYGDAAALISAAVQQFKADVESGSYPSDEESYHLPKETKAALDAIMARKQMKAYVR